MEVLSIVELGERLRCPSLQPRISNMRIQCIFSSLICRCRTGDWTGIFKLLCGLRDANIVSAEIGSEWVEWTKVRFYLVIICYMSGRRLKEKFLKSRIHGIGIADVENPIWSELGKVWWGGTLFAIWSSFSRTMILSLGKIVEVDWQGGHLLFDSGRRHTGRRWQASRQPDACITMIAKKLNLYSLLPISRASLVC